MLVVYKDASLTDIVSAGNPITTTHSTDGGTVEQKVYLSNDDPAFTYQNISIDPVDLSGPDESTWITLAPDNAGVPGAYLAAGAALTMADIMDSNVAKPFWVKVTTPVLTGAQNNTSIALDISFDEFAV